MGAKVIRRWSNDALQRLHDAYVVRFWPGQLDGWRVEAVSLPRGMFATCHRSERRIVIDLTKHRSHREVRGTLLHEMCHSITPWWDGQHGWLFFREVDRLLTLGVRPSVNWKQYWGVSTASAARAKMAEEVIEICEM